MSADFEVGSPQYRKVLRRWQVLDNLKLLTGLTPQEQREYDVLGAQLAAAELAQNLIQAKEGVDDSQISAGSMAASPRACYRQRWDTFAVVALGRNSVM